MPDTRSRAVASLRELASSYSQVPGLGTDHGVSPELILDFWKGYDLSCCLLEIPKDGKGGASAGADLGCSPV